MIVAALVGLSAAWAAAQGLPAFPGPELQQAPKPAFSAAPAACAKLDDLDRETCGGGGYPTADEQAANLAKADIQNEAQTRAFAAVQAATDKAGGVLDGEQSQEIYELVYAQQAEQLTFDKMGVTGADFQALTVRVKAAILAAIDAQSGLSVADKARFKRIIGMDRVLLPSQYLQEPGISRDQARQGLSDVCGGSGLVTNAFADKDIAAMIFCPGYLIDTATVYQARTPAQRLSAMELVIAHELSHTIDNNTLSVAAQYGPMATCVKSLAAASPDQFPDDLGHKFGELAADHWAVEAFRFLHPFADAGSLAALEDGLRLFCGSPENAEHPAGSFRISWAGRNPDLRVFFGCPAASVARPACGWRGLVH